MVKTLDTNAAYYFSGIPAYIIIGPHPTGVTYVQVRQIGTHDLLAHSTDLYEVSQRLIPMP